jgi:hypothetical protein
MEWVIANTKSKLVPIHCTVYPYAPTNGNSQNQCNSWEKGRRIFFLEIIIAVKHLPENLEVLSLSLLRILK